jgi:RNA polymerase-binding transcription factor DksA
MNAVSTLVKGAREMRLARYRSCSECGEKRAPELLSADEVCDACADAQRDVVH